MTPKTFFCVTIILFLTSCQESEKYDRLMQLADSLMDYSNDIATACTLIDDSIGTQTDRLSHRQQMHYRMLQLKARNKQDRLTEADTAFSQVTDYYHHHGSANEQVEALYLLGRVYHDMGRLPQAIDLYQQADQAADTTRSDCNWRHLFLVHSQLSQLYSDQRLPDRELEELELLKHCAIKSRDTLNVLLCDSWIASALWNKGEYEKAVEQEQKVNLLLINNGYQKTAYGNNAFIIFHHLSNHKALEARKYMDIQERKSGIFDSLGNIEKGREIYYYSMGAYQLLVNHLDSAEMYFRRLLALAYEPDHLEAAYRGLFNLYQKKANTDSIAKYAQLYCNANDSALIRLSTEKIQFIKSLYDYRHFQDIATKKESEAKTILYTSTIIVQFLLVIIMIVLCLFYIYRKGKRKRQQEDMEKYAEVYRRYTQLLNAKQDIEIKMSKSEEREQQLEEQKTIMEGEIARLTLIIANKQNDHQRPEKWRLENEILTSSEVVSLHQYASRGTAPSSLWSDLYTKMYLYLPQFMVDIDKKEMHLTDFEKQVAILTKLRFLGSEIQNLLKKSSQSISNSRSNINRKLFGGEGVGGFDVSIYKLGELLQPSDVKDVDVIETIDT